MRLLRRPQADLSVDIGSKNRPRHDSDAMPQMPNWLCSCSRQANPLICFPAYCCGISPPDLFFFIGRNPWSGGRRWWSVPSVPSSSARPTPGWSNDAPGQPTAPGQPPPEDAAPPTQPPAGGSSCQRPSVAAEPPYRRFRSCRRGSRRRREVRPEVSATVASGSVAGGPEGATCCHRTPPPRVCMPSSVAYRAM